MSLGFYRWHQHSACCHRCPGVVANFAAGTLNPLSTSELLARLCFCPSVSWRQFSSFSVIWDVVACRRLQRGCWMYMCRCFSKGESANAERKRNHTYSYYVPFFRLNAKDGQIEPSWHGWQTSKDGSQKVHLHLGRLYFPDLFIMVSTIGNGWWRLVH